ncbi:hypothetical protein [Clostridium thailandense]|uniref:hypothetical protein n=1 Tax=Clostridium thailandense TaxID=2794346 RepID=UPI0039892FC9
MNKIKVLYDVFKTMKEKELFNGSINVEAVKIGTKVLSFSNEFSANTATGETKIKINSESNFDENKSKHESTTEFNIKNCKHHKFHHHMHPHHHGMSCDHGSIKAKLSKVTFMLNILNSLKIEEQNDKSILSLELKEIIREFKEQHKDLDKHHKDFCEQNMGEHHKHCACIKDFIFNANNDAVLNVCVNKNNEVEKIEIVAKGENSLNASLNLAW